MARMREHHPTVGHTQHLRWFGMLHQTQKETGNQTLTKETRNRHKLLMLTIVLFGALIGGGSAGILYLFRGNDFELRQYYSWACMGFLVAWWIVYFSYKPLGIYNLRAFLRNKNPYRDDKDDEHFLDQSGPVEVHESESDPKDKATNLVTKAAFSLGEQAILIAIVAFFLNLVLTSPARSQYQSFLRPVIVLLALVIILLMVFAIDILDTAANVFRRGEESSFEYRRWFNSSVGPGLPNGGASYAYSGFAFFTGYIVLGLSFYYPLISGVGIALYAYLGYSFLFGYRGVEKDGEIEVEIDEAASRESFWIGGLLLAAAVLVFAVT